jgi:glycosyltransferase involved in cell wall biosynthesis
VSKCRLLYIVGQLGAGGLERQLGYLIQAMDRNRLHPRVAVWNYDEVAVNARRLKLLGVDLVAVPPIRSRLSRLLWLSRAAAVLGPDVVHSYSFYTNALVQPVARNAISVGSIRADFTRDRESTGSILGRICAQWPRAQICNSAAAKNKIARSRTIFKPSRVFLVRNALDLDQFPYKEMPAAGTPLIMGLGSLVSFKRWDRLIRVAHTLSRRGIRAQVVIVGDGPERSRLQSQIDHLGLNATVLLAGYREDVAETIGQATILVHSSDSEVCPNAVMEAMACGRAVVATDAGDTAELIRDGETGFVVPMSDENSLTERVVELVTNVPLARQMGMAGRDRAKTLFGCDRLVDETLGAYRSLGWAG